ncbi:hypothetical protein Zmor_011953 [Zophobas morio]|uniref:EF-hand domain-containing protein n=1 Tax=Zophobas morio TaxID=2755281 RepID=A0AA38HIQ1_9CUCU|nr:hypothetical protein Zmor_011953 [Zophobas morio]
MPASIVSEEELKKAQAHFSIYDRTGDGTISVNDIGNVIRSLNRNPLNSEIKKSIESFGKKTKITFPEFALLLSSLHDVQGNPEDFKNALKVFEKDVKGHMPLVELRRVLQNLGEKLESSEVDRVLSGISDDPEGNIDYLRFIDKITASQDLSL